MKKTVKMFLAVLKAKFEEVKALGRGLYLVKGGQGCHSWWGIYSSKAKGVVCSGDKCEILSPDLISFEERISYSGKGGRTDYYLFSLQKNKVVDFGGYRGSSFELCERNWIRALFLKTVEKRNDVDVVGGMGVFDVSKNSFIIQPVYDELISLGSSQYYGTKKNHRTGQHTYFLISINEKGKVVTQKTSKIV